MITKVRLRNWRSHADSELDFTSGTNALLGILGSGKSSVLDGICFCLFGTFPTLQARKLKIEDLIMKKPAEKEFAELEVFFNQDGKEYSVKRTINRGRGTTYSEVKENGKIIESPNTSRVNELVGKVLKVNYDLFSKAIYSEQNSLDYFLTIPKGMRMKKIDELLMIDRFENARKNSVAVINKFIERREAKQGVIDGARLEEAERAAAELKDSVSMLRKEAAEIQERVGQATSQRRSVEKEMGETRKIKDALEALRREEKGVVSLVEDTYASVEKMEKSMKEEDMGSVEKDLREVVRFLVDIERATRDEQSNYDKVHRQMTKAQTELEVIKRDSIDRLEEELREKTEMKDILKKNKMNPERLEKDLDKKRKAIEKFIGEMEVMRIKVRDLQEVVTELNDVKGKCPLCDAKVTKEKKVMLIKKKKFEIDEIKEKFAKAWKEKDLTQKELEQLQEGAKRLEGMLSAVKDLDKVQGELNASKNVYSVLKEQLSSFETEFEQAKREVDSLSKRMSEARGRKEELEVMAVRARDYSEKKGKIESLLQKRKEIAASISNLESSVTGKQGQQLEKMWEELVTQEKEMAGRASGIAGIVGEKEARLKEMESSMSGARKELGEVRKLEGLIEEMKIFEKCLEATQSQLRKEFVTSVNYTMNELWPSLYPYRDFTGLQLSIEEGDYVLQLQERPGRWVNVEGFASGGERSIAALTLRISFALVLAPQLRWLVLDEPTANMDVKAVEDLATTLSEHIGDFIDQAFLITHDEKLEKAVTGYAYKLERDKGKNEPTRVVQI